jgi:hypothetical protein
VTSPVFTPGTRVKAKHSLGIKAAGTPGDVLPCTCGLNDGYDVCVRFDDDGAEFCCHTSELEPLS